MQKEQISLYYKDGSSDKEYHAQLAPKNDLWVVNFQYGRRFSTLKAETKTKNPLDFVEAKKIYDKLIKEKIGKGYTEGVDGAKYQNTDMSDKFSGVVPQLLNVVEESELKKLFMSPDWIMQEKHDGNRTMVKVTDDGVIGINKKGLIVSLPVSVESKCKLLPMGTIIDGELVGEKYYVFDCLEFKGVDLKNSPVLKRLSNLNKTEVESLITKTYSTPSEKEEAFATIKINRGEGVVFKKNDSKYIPGRPASGGNQLKFKFIESATVSVENHTTNARSIGMYIFDENNIKISIGKVSIPPNYSVPDVDSIIEVEYLYAYRGGALYQPVYKGVRIDQDISDCVITQLKYKQDLDVENGLISSTESKIIPPKKF